MIPIYNFADLSPDQILNRDIQAEADVSAAVDEILSGVREGGDEALRAYTRRFDGAEIPDLEVSPQEIEAAWSSLDPDFAPRWSWRRKISAISTASRSTGISWWRIGPAL